jgi:hypothetical protein
MSRFALYKPRPSGGESNPECTQTFPGSAWEGESGPATEPKVDDRLANFE